MRPFSALGLGRRYAHFEIPADEELASHDGGGRFPKIKKLMREVSNERSITAYVKIIMCVNLGLVGNLFWWWGWDKKSSGVGVVKLPLWVYPIRSGMQLQRSTCVITIKSCI